MTRLPRPTRLFRTTCLALAFLTAGAGLGVTAAAATPTGKAADVSLLGCRQGVYGSVSAVYEIDNRSREPRSYYLTVDVTTPTRVRVARVNDYVTVPPSTATQQSAPLAFVAGEDRVPGLSCQIAEVR